MKQGKPCCEHILGFIIEAIKSARVDLVDTIIDYWSISEKNIEIIPLYVSYAEASL